MLVGKGLLITEQLIFGTLWIVILELLIRYLLLNFNMKCKLVKDFIDS